MVGMRFFKRLRRRESGQALVEYAIIIALVSIVAILSLGKLGNTVSKTFETVVGEVGTTGGDDVTNVDAMALEWETEDGNENEFRSNGVPKISINHRYEGGRYIYEFDNMDHIMRNPYGQLIRVTGLDHVEFDLRDDRRFAMEYDDEFRMRVQSSGFDISVYNYANGDGSFRWVIRSNKPLVKGYIRFILG